MSAIHPTTVGRFPFAVALLACITAFISGCSSTQEPVTVNGVPWSDRQIFAIYAPPLTVISETKAAIKEMGLEPVRVRATNVDAYLEVATALGSKYRIIIRPGTPDGTPEGPTMFEIWMGGRPNENIRDLLVKKVNGRSDLDSPGLGPTVKVIR